MVKGKLGQYALLLFFHVLPTGQLYVQDFIGNAAFWLTSGLGCCLSTRASLFNGRRGVSPFAAESYHDMRGCLMIRYPCLHGEPPQGANLLGRLVYQRKARCVVRDFELFPDNAKMPQDTAP